MAREELLLAFKMAGGEQPWRVEGPSGPVSVVGFVLAGDEAQLDNGALHARGRLEAGVRFSEDPAAHGKGERVVNVWVAQSEARFSGACAVELWVDRAARTGWKRTVDHVNQMSSAVRGTIDLRALAPSQRKSLGALLAKLDPEAWGRSPELAKALEG